MKHLTSGQSSFERLIKDNSLYVDKTEYIWKMVSAGENMYFLSRPRRFGKSLTVTTLKALFEGKRELFKDLAIDGKDYDWKPYPVIHLNLLNCHSHSEDDLREFLGMKLEDIAEEFHLSVPINRRQLSVSFSKIIREIYSMHGQVVILIDEYDKPLLENLTNGKAPEIRDVLSEFYTTVKLEDSRERFVFLTGVTKFSRVSIFSTLNNLQDMTMDARYATMLGYTQEELEANFGEMLAELAARQAVPYDQFLAKVKDWYDGFRFVENAETVYNPVSVASFLEKQGAFKNYWFETGTPTFLMEQLKRTRFDFEKVLTQPVGSDAFSAFEIDRIEPMVLMLQTGYMTIKGMEIKNGRQMYRVGFPNFEVKHSFESYLLNAYSGIGLLKLGNLTGDMQDSLVEGRTDDFVKALQAFLANIPYDIQLRDEKYYQSILYVLFLVLGIYVQAEARTNRGRIDAFVSMDRHVYIMEFKVNKSAKEALDQIRETEYCQRFSNCGKTLHLLGISIATETRQIADWAEERRP